MVSALVLSFSEPKFKDFAQSAPETIQQRHLRYVQMEQKAYDDEIWAKRTLSIAEYLKMGDDLKRASEIAEAVRDSSEEFGVEADLILRIIRVESMGNPNAVSRVGAIGLTQVMPNTAEEIAAELGVRWSGPGMLKDVKLNVRFGTYYFSKLRNKFDSNYIALGAYNWGPGYVDECLALGRGLPRIYPNKVLRGRGPELMS